MQWFLPWSAWDSPPFLFALAPNVEDSDCDCDQRTGDGIADGRVVAFAVGYAQCGSPPYK